MIKRIIIAFNLLIISFSYAALDFNRLGIVLNLTAVTNLQPELIVTLPDGSKLEPQKSKGVSIPISTEKILFRGQWRGKSFTKGFVFRVDNEVVAAQFYYSDAPEKEIIPLRTAIIGIRYPNVAEVIPNTTDKIGHKEVIFYKSNNEIKLRISPDGIGELFPEQRGAWIAAVRIILPNGTDDWKKMGIKQLLDAKRQPIKSGMDPKTKQLLTEAQLLDDAIRNKKIIKAEMDYRANLITLITR